ncbi:MULTISPECIES: TetR/AcrR family transcriptional regulator [Sphingomonas]|uniref:Helix-turn-helix domain-containing protein n=1 Tax=Sphingomonas kyungheensis TaxID=1069987 RepID=A0ABU8GY62_9SPHN|nr:TetR/AcrR family transcriptional regulator [Sphingomonas sp. RIT328]
MRRFKVIEAARRLFIENGFHATGIAQIARESGVAVGQLYRDFSAKEDIVAAIVNSDCRSFLSAESLRRAIQAKDVGHVRDWLHQLVTPGRDDDESDGDPRLFAEILAEAARNSRIASIFNATHQDVRALMLDALEMLAPGDALADRRSALADVILIMSLGMLHHSMVRPDEDDSALVEALVATIDRDVDALRRAAVVDKQDG